MFEYTNIKTVDIHLQPSCHLMKKKVGKQPECLLCLCVRPFLGVTCGLWQWKADIHYRHHCWSKIEMTCNGSPWLTLLCRDGHWRHLQHWMPTNQGFDGMVTIVSTKLYDESSLYCYIHTHTICFISNICRPSNCLCLPPFSWTLTSMFNLVKSKFPHLANINQVKIKFR